MMPLAQRSTDNLCFKGRTDGPRAAPLLLQPSVVARAATEDSSIDSEKMMKDLQAKVRLGQRRRGERAQEGGADGAVEQRRPHPHGSASHEPVAASNHR